MEYYKFSFPVENSTQRELLLARLVNFDFDGYEEDDSGLFAYSSENKIAEAQELADEFGLGEVSTELIPAKNWNEQWESDFAPVVVGSFCTIRAGFHKIDIATQHEIVITPKMSFGTGHHDTTRLMIMQMEKCDFTGTNVLDYGSGTGVLAILAAKLGAGTIHAVDVDEWAVENSKENVVANDCHTIDIFQGTIEAVPELEYDWILANINRHILIESMTDLYRKTAPGGKVLMSGILREDSDIIQETATKAGFILSDQNVSNNWLLLEFEKKF